MAEPLQPKTTGELGSLIPGDWFEHPDEASAWLRIYMPVFAPHEVLGQSLTAWAESEKRLLRLGKHVLFAFGEISGMKVPTATWKFNPQPNGQLNLTANVGEKELTKGQYVMLGLPFRDGSTPGDEPAVRRTLDLIVGLMAAHAGLNLLRDLVFEGEVDRKTSQISTPGDHLKVPQPMDGPFLGVRNADDISELSKALADALEPKRGRLELALQVLHAAMRKDEGLLEYWMALEICCDGKTNRILDRIGKIYKLKGHAEAGKRTGLRVVADWRDDYVHQGKFHALTGSVERYLQLAFLDLLRYELELEPRHHLAAIQAARGYDLSPLGLPNNQDAGPPQASAPEQGVR